MKTLLTLLLLIAILFGCEKNDPEPEIVDYRLTTIHWGGDPNLDGCGFTCIIAGENFKPINQNFFGTQFKTAKDTTVEMKYKDYKRMINGGCPMGSIVEMPGIEVLDVR
jgi:hypothetical protein